jgi:hypothetical protein
VLTVEKALAVAAMAVQAHAGELRGYDVTVIVAASDGNGDVALFSSFPEGDQVMSTMRRLLVGVWERGRILLKGFEQ